MLCVRALPLLVANVLVNFLAPCSQGLFLCLRFARHAHHVRSCHLMSLGVPTPYTPAAARLPASCFASCRGHIPCAPKGEPHAQRTSSWRHRNQRRQPSQLRLHPARRAQPQPKSHQQSLSTKSEQIMASAKIYNAVHFVWPPFNLTCVS